MRYYSAAIKNVSVYSCILRNIVFGPTILQCVGVMADTKSLYFGIYLEREYGAFNVGLFQDAIKLLSLLVTVVFN
jgi:hypothetical protein